MIRRFQQFRVGDIINVTGPSVPADLEDKWFRVEAITEQGPQLSPPYLDSACTLPYHPPRPELEGRAPWKRWS